MGESAEKTAAREVAEEIGQKAEKITFVRSFPYEKKEMLMLGYKVEVKKEDLVLSGEVDQAQWFSMEEAREKLRPGSIAWQLVNSSPFTAHIIMPLYQPITGRYRSQ